MRQLPSGVAVASFTVATNQVWNDQNGVRQERAEFHDIVAWRKLAEICGQLMTKGAKVYVEGRLQTREWTGEDGVKRRKTEIVADNVILLDRKTAGLSPASAMTQDRPVASPVAAAPVASTASEDPLEDKEPVAVSATETVSEDEVTIDDLPF